MLLNLSHQLHYQVVLYRIPPLFLAGCLYDLWFEILKITAIGDDGMVRLVHVEIVFFILLDFAEDHAVLH